MAVSLSEGLFLSKTLLCGKFLGYGDFVPAMTRLFLDEAGKLYAETWLVVQEIGLAFDLDSRKPGEEYGLVSKSKGTH